MLAKAMAAVTAIDGHSHGAATALVHGMVVVTRNLGDFESTGVPLLNPWDGFHAR